MSQYKYSKDDYYRLTNAPCIDVALALGMEINERASDQKAWKIKDEQGLCIYREGNNWYRFSDGKHGFSIDLVIDKLGCTREQALDFIARNVVNDVSEQVRLGQRPPAAKPKEELPKEKIFTVPALPGNISTLVHRKLIYIIACILLPMSITTPVLIRQKRFCYMPIVLKKLRLIWRTTTMR